MTVPFMPDGVNLPLYATGATAVPQGMMSIPEMAGAADQVVQNVMRVEPMIAGIAGMFVPGLSLVQPWIVMLVPYLEQALNDLSKSNNGAVLPSILQLINHITAGLPNSPALSPLAVSQTSSAFSPSGSPSQDASAQGSA